MIEIPIDEAGAEAHLPPGKLDGSGIGINYADAYLKPLKITLADGRKVACKRRGLKLTFTIGDRTGEALMRRLENGPDEKTIFRAALREAAALAGGTIEFRPGALALDPDGAAAS
jgi:hypothetical protein